jgi:signal peptidase II
MKKNKIYFIIIFALIIFDQATKLAVKGFNFFGFEHIGFRYGELRHVFGDKIMLTFIENPGMAFGIEFGAAKILLSIFSFVAGFALIWYLNKIYDASIWIKTGLSLIIAGALGNGIDRVFYGVIFGESALFYGKVVDFIQVDIPDVSIFGLYYSHFPVFNVADSCVTVGVILLLIFHNKLPDVTQFLKKKNNNETVENTLEKNEQ